MSDMIEEAAQPLRPHTYPMWIKVFIALLVWCVFCSLFLTSRYFDSAMSYGKGDSAFDNKNFAQAISYYEEALKQVPNSKKIKLRLAEVYFSSGGDENAEKALEILEGVTLDEHKWNELTTVMPKQYQNYFNKVN